MRDDSSPVAAERVDDVDDDARQLVEPPVAGLMDARIDLAVALGVVAFGAGLIALAQDVSPGSIPDPVGSDGMPELIGLFMILTAGVVAVRRLLAMRRLTGHQVATDGGVADEPGYPGSALRVFGLLAGAYVWALLLEPVGYIPVTLLLAAASLAAMGIRSVRQLILLPIAFVITMWALFGQLLNLRLPSGLFGELIGRVL